MQFEPFPKMPRLSRDVTITEKIDGTNAQVTIVREENYDAEPAIISPVVAEVNSGLGGLGTYYVLAGSRNRWVTPQADNYGFAKWVAENAIQLVATLGEGTHFGEWWGQGIQRNYSQTEKHFSLFNTKRWGTHYNDQGRVGPCRVVPTLYEGPLDNHEVMVGVKESLRLLHAGSVAAPGFMKPEGIVIFHHAGNFCFKKTLDKDEEPKGKLESLGRAVARLVPDAYPGATETTMGGR